LLDRTANALAVFRAKHPAARGLVAAGGVAANAALRQGLAALAAKTGCDLVLPPPDLCTDNAAMIAWAGLERFKAGLVDGLDFAPRPRWPLDPAAAPMRS
jgi:N6-L-threonylcarbamoyladenine synthase